MTTVPTRDRSRVEPPPQLPIDPRIAARWLSVQRDQDRRRRRVAIGAMTAVSAVVGLWLLARSPLLATQHVVVRGLGHTGRGAVLSAAGLDHPRPMVDIDGTTLERRIRALPWVADVEVRRVWPTTVTIDIRERVAAAQLTTSAGQAAIIDHQGRVLAVAGAALEVLAAETPALPRLVGVDVRGPPGSTVAPAAGGMLAILQALDPMSPVSPKPPVGSPAGSPVGSPMANRFDLLAVSQAPDGTLDATLAPGPVTVVFGSTAQLGAKVVALQSLLTQLAPGQVATIDVQVADAPVLTESKNSSSVSTAQRG
jgi:POTRA domain, FtsQ-type/Cell division protein FtsQ